MDRNTRRHLIKKCALAASTPLLFLLSFTGIMWTHGDFGWDSLIFVVGGTLLASMFMTTAMGSTFFSFLDSRITRAISPHLDVNSVRRMVLGLVEATRQGLPSDRRLSLMNDIRRADEVLLEMCGRSAWIEAAENGFQIDSSHLALRGERLRQSGLALADMVEKKHGTDLGKLRIQIARSTPLIASIARDFGLDAYGFAPSERLVPGQIRGEPTPVPQLAAPTISLADEWLSGSKGGVPELLALAADSAARRDLDELQRSWKAARLSALNDDAATRVDETFSAALSDISRTLCDAIAARSSGDERNLAIQGRYIETKHGLPVGDLVAS